MSAYDFFAILGSHLVWLIVTLEQLLGGSAFSNCPTRRTSSCFVEHIIPDEDGRFRTDTQERTSVDYKLQGRQWLLKKNVLRCSFGPDELHEDSRRLKVRVAATRETISALRRKPKQRKRASWEHRGLTPATFTWWVQPHSSAPVPRSGLIKRPDLSWARVKWGRDSTDNVWVMVPPSRCEICLRLQSKFFS